MEQLKAHPLALSSRLSLRLQSASPDCVVFAQNTVCVSCPPASNSYDELFALLTVLLLSTNAIITLVRDIPFADYLCRGELASSLLSTFWKCCSQTPPGLEMDEMADMTLGAIG